MSKIISSFVVVSGLFLASNGPTFCQTLEGGSQVIPVTEPPPSIGVGDKSIIGNYTGRYKSTMGFSTFGAGLSIQASNDGGGLKAILQIYGQACPGSFPATVEVKGNDVKVVSEPSRGCAVRTLKLTRNGNTLFGTIQGEGGVEVDIRLSK